MLIDASTGIIHVIRALTIPPPLAAALHGAINRQAMADWPGHPTYDQALARIYQRYPSTDSMLAIPGIIRGIGGE